MPRLTAGSGGREAGESEGATSFGCLGRNSPTSHASVWYRVRTAERPQQDFVARQTSDTVADWR